MKVLVLLSVDSFPVVAELLVLLDADIPEGKKQEEDQRKKCEVLS
jgi:hypothetical protein